MRTRPDLRPVSRDLDPDYSPFTGDLTERPAAAERPNPGPGPDDPLVEHAGTGTVFTAAALLALGLLVVVLLVG